MGHWYLQARRVAQRTADLSLALALIGEAGEACDNIKNLIRDGTFDEDYLAYELGDLIYYWTCLCVELGKTPSDMLTKSRANIEQRIAELVGQVIFVKVAVADQVLDVVARFTRFSD